MAASAQLHLFKYADFTDKRELGKGEFGVVYAANHHQFKKLVVRVMSRRYYARREEQNVLQREAEKLFLMVSEQVIRLLGIVMEPEHLCLVFEYAEYGSLDKMLMRHNVPWPLKIRIAYEIALGMCFLHDKDVLHLRLKCRNILVAGNIHVKISDVCFTRNGEMNTWTRYADIYSQSVGQSSSRALGGSIAHVPPELIRNVNANPDKAADVYAYGIILWQLLSDKTPYEGVSPKQICNDVVNRNRPSDSLLPQDKPDTLYNLMRRCWVDSKVERPSFLRIQNEMKPVFHKFESDARKLALECQKDIADFCFPQSFELGSPEGDIRPIRRGSLTKVSGATGNVTRPKSSVDGLAVPVSTSDKKVVVGESASPKMKAPPIPTYEVVREQAMETNLPEENKDKPIAQLSPAENSQRALTADDLYRVAEELGNRWRQFGRFLGFTDGQLDNIELNYQRNGFPETPYQMLRRWKEDNSAQVTVGYLVKMLTSNGQRHIAARLNP